MVALIGLAVTVTLSWTTWQIDRNNERRLLQVQTRQAANVVALAIVSLQSPLQTAASIAVATDGDTHQFASFMSRYTGSAGPFVAASLWQSHGGAPVFVTTTGDVLAPRTQTSTLITRAIHVASFAVNTIAVDGQQRIGYALSDPKDSGYVVYAERVIPANREVAAESNPAFSDLHFATYLGTKTDAADLQTTDQPLSQLPIKGTTARETIPFGDTTITLVTSPIGHLGGSLGSRLPWILLGGGIILSAVAALTIAQLIRRRQTAERDTSTITNLNSQLASLLTEQRTISLTLQHALLPQTNPSIPGLDIATRYLAGADGVDIGGDWYSIILINGTHFAFVIGDVSGRGVEAAALMARIRFTLLAYLIEGHSPTSALQMASKQLDLNEDGHFATVLVGVGDLATRQITLANAGHLNPLIITDVDSYFVDTVVEPPLGVAEGTYPSVTTVMPSGSTLLAFTDGLVERRTEDLDIGLRRLADAATKSPPRQRTDDLLTTILATMAQGTVHDDTALLAFTWTPEPAETDMQNSVSVAERRS